MIEMLTKLKNNRLYITARNIKRIMTDQPDFHKILKSYYGWAEKESSKYAPLVIEHMGDKHPDKIIYWINYASSAVASKKGLHSGMYANIRRVMEWINFADTLGMIPVVESGKGEIYYDEGMDHITTNVFEYYYKPVSEITCSEVRNCCNVVRHRYGHSNFFMEHGCDSESYKITDDEIKRLGYIYKKYIHLNKTTAEYVDSEISKLLGNEKTVGVHIRGTDYKLGLKNHPNIIPTDDYVNEVKEVLRKNDFMQIFLATDDSEILRMFQNEFGDKLVYYKDAFRVTGENGVQNTYNERSLHYYKLGLEVIRDVYTLASCDSLICGLSQVAFAARYVKISMGREYNTLKIIDHGIKK